MSALPASLDCEVRSDGDDDNGGWYDAINDPGSDYSQQASAQKSGTDLEIHSSDSTKVRPVAAGVASADVGNCVNITAGTGFTVDRFMITSQDGTWWTLDSSAGTTSSTGGTYKMGGALASCGPFGAHENNYQICHVRGGTYSISTSNNVNGGRATLTSYVAVVGYNTTRYDYGTPPVFQFSSGASQFFTCTPSYNAAIQIHNISVDYQGGTTGTGFSATGSYADNAVCYRCKGEDGNHGFSNGVAVECYSLNANSYGFNATKVSHCHAKGASYGFWYPPGLSHCLAEGNTYGARTYFNSASMSHLTAYNNSSHGIYVTGTYQPLHLNGLLLVNNGGYGIGLATTGYSRAHKLRNIITENNTSGDYNGTKYGHHEFTELTGDPFVDAAGGDFRINETAGAGAVVRAAGMGILDQTGHLHTGGVQGADPAGGGSDTIIIPRRRFIR